MRGLITLVVLAITTTAAADHSAILRLCTGCHGPSGVSPWDDVPNIAGLPDVVISNALYDYRGSQRPCRQPACTSSGECPDLDMCVVAQPMSDALMDDIGKHFAKMDFTVVENPYDAGLAEKGRAVHERLCERCHTAGGSDPLDEASILRGQKTTYIRQALNDFRAKKRLGEQPMIESFEVLSDDEIEALANFYASPPE